MVAFFMSTKKKQTAECVCTHSILLGGERKEREKGVNLAGLSTLSLSLKRVSLR